MPDLRRLALVLEALPDEALLARLTERARALPGSCGGRPSPCFGTSGRWFGDSTATRRTLCGFSPLDYQDKPKVDDDGKPVVFGTPQHGEPQLLPVESP